MNEIIDTHNLVITFGKHKGMLWTRAPISYLKWILQNFDEKTITYQTAKAEMERRGATETYVLEISGHAIDRASQRLLSIWMRDCPEPAKTMKGVGKKNERKGLNAWLYHRASKMLIDKDLSTDTENYTTNDGEIKYVFAVSGQWPTLITVMKVKK